MKWLWLSMMAGCLAFGQQQVVPDELSAAQKKTFQKVTVAVSAPCCNNGIPVAYHDSPLADHIRGIVKTSLLEGKKESQIMEELAASDFNGRKIIFTVPEKNSLGFLFWALPGLMVLMGAIGIFVFIKGRRPRKSVSEDELIDKYRAFILKQAGIGD